MLLALLMCFSTIFGLGTTAFAAGEQAEVYMIGFPRDGDANYGGEWGHPDLNYMNGWSSGKSSYTNIRAMNSYEGNICYCIEPGVPQDTGDTFTSWDENFWDNYPAELNSTISPDEIKTFIGRILQYGYTGPISLNWRSQNEGGDKLAYAVATQLLIWETVIGERNSDFGKVDTGSYDAVIDSVGVNHPLYTQIMSYYNSIASSVKTHATLPSFLAKSTGKAQEVEMEWNGSEYIATLTDSNGVLGNYSFTANVIGIDFSISGNTLTITADEAPTDTVTITASKKNSQRMGVITWTDGTNNPNSGIQDVVTYAQFVDQLLQPAPSREEAQTQNPTEGRNAKSRQSEPTSRPKKSSARGVSDTADRSARPSVRQELSEIRDGQRQKAEAAKGSQQRQQPAQQHKAPPKKPKKAKER